MNIFVTGEHAQCCYDLDDARLIKMILESTQLLANAAIINNTPQELWPIAKSTGKPFKVTHKNHPCSVWARKNSENYAWLWRYAKAACLEYGTRFGKTHYLHDEIRKLEEVIYHLPYTEDYVEFVNCSRYKDESDVIFAYRKTLRDKWKEDELKGRPPKWTFRGKPAWYNNDLTLEVSDDLF